MNLNELMARIQSIHFTATEWAQAAGDSLGITVTTLWLVGLHHAVDGVLHTVIASVTLASVSFTLFTKVKGHFKDRKNGISK